MSNLTHSVRQYIVHAHMFKNAGTTLDWSLQYSFGERFFAHTDDAVLRDRPRELERVMLESGRISALSSHWLPLPLSPVLANQTALLVLLRHPIIRAQSVYLFERGQQGDHGPSSTAAKQMDFREFVEWRLSPGRGPVIHNFQTRYLSGHFHDECNEERFEQALETLDAALVGIVERYDDSMILFETALCKEFPELDLASRPKNVSATAAQTIGERLQQIKQELGDTFVRLSEANVFDLQLYERGCALLNARLAGIRGLEQRRSEFAQRCEALS
ncbi:sulfotransferase family 2 domain-containing protein [Parahalioglobus pacificus]|uniref:Sulfotransferase family protein n=1 Tax=Parahalioglobus pacificus TaxID=930806 RepID=A0A918XH90_9GAMM|nr:sulfotransferase family 2 domain-containing protein [Halioglobus pacificus]GHD31918.1 hypothetical protein GCM10007053_15480 [Halioglobus pacificus]